MSILQTTALLASLAASVSAHGYLDGITVGGKYYSGTSPNWIYGDKPDTAGWYAKNQDNGYVPPSSFAEGDIICHKEATVGGTPVPVTAGDKLDLSWNTWPESHHGPVIDYLAPVSGAWADVDKTALEFFKIDQGGLVDGSSAPGTWASDDLIANNNTWSVTIPTGIAPGKYVLRHEIIALHSAGQSDGAQNYPQCVNLEITSSGTDTPSGTLGTALYKEDDPGILINIYTALSSYTIPGPALYSGASSGSETGAASSASAVKTTAAASSTASAAPSSSPSSYGGSLSVPYANTSAPATSYIAPTSTSAVAPVVSTTAYTTVDAVETATATATAYPSYSSQASVAPAAPSSTEAAAEPTGYPSSGSEESAWGEKPSKPLPKGYTLKDLEMWVAYLTKPEWDTGVQARKFKRFVA